MQPSPTQPGAAEEAYRFAAPYELPVYPFVAPPELACGDVRRHPVVIVGAGPSGLTLACDLALRGVPALLLDEDDTVGVRGASSRGICQAQKSLEIFDRLGIAEQIVNKGVRWSVGRTFSGDSQIYDFNLSADSVSEQPPFVNLQQFHLERMLVERIAEIGVVDLRWKNRVSTIEPHHDHVLLTIETPAGSYRIAADWLVDASGAHSVIRAQLGFDTRAARSADRWCISDVRFSKPLPTERWTWVDAPFNDGRGVWQHLMADDVWRIDYQMAEDADPEQVTRPEVAGSRLRRQLGAGVDFEFVWIGAYQYRHHLLDDFRSGRVFFIGDAAHVVSPFGARGGNSGVQDAANLGWKLALVLAGQAGEALLDSYQAERHPAAQQNLEVTSRTARFMAPRSEAEHLLRRAAIALARCHPFARTLVNTGRMSVANPYPPAPCLPDGATSVQNLRLAQAGGGSCRLMELLRDGTHLLALWFDPDPAQVQAVRDALAALPVVLHAVGGTSVLPTLVDPDRRLAGHLGARPGMLCLIRPDAYLAARIEPTRAPAVAAAVRTALGVAAPGVQNVPTT